MHKNAVDFVIFCHRLFCDKKYQFTISRSVSVQLNRSGLISLNTMGSIKRTKHIVSKIYYPNVFNENFMFYDYENYYKFR